MSRTTFADFGITGIDPNGPAEQRTTCPQCSAHRRKTQDRCLSVNIVDGVWLCFHCGETGSLKAGKGDDQRREFRTVDRKERAVRPVAETEKVMPPTVAAYEYLLTRGLSRSTVDALEIGSTSRRFSDGITRPAIAFRYRMGGTLVNIKYRSFDKGWQMVKGGSLVLWGVDRIGDGSSLIITEGEIDAASYEEVRMSYPDDDLPVAVSVPGGAIGENDKHIDRRLTFLDTCEAALRSVRRFYLSTDADGPGERLRNELARRLGLDRCYLITYPAGCKDANDVLQKFGVDGLRSCLDRAQPWPMQGILSVDALSSGVLSVYSVGWPAGAETGIREIDELLQVHAGTLTTITGIPSHGKSTLQDFLALRRAYYMSLHGAPWRVGIYSPENRPTEVHTIRLAEMLVGKPFSPGRSVRMTEAELREALGWLNETFFYINPSEIGYTPEAVLDASSYLVRRYGIRELILDPWNSFEHQTDLRKETESAYIARVLNLFRSWSGAHGVATQLIAHPRKIDQQSRDEPGIYRVPGPYDISGSAHFYNITDNGATVYRIWEYEDGLRTERSTTEYHIWKAKHRHYGRPGMVELRFNDRCQRFDVTAAYDETNFLDILSGRDHVQRRNYVGRADDPLPF